MKLNNLFLVKVLAMIMVICLAMLACISAVAFSGDVAGNGVVGTILYLTLLVVGAVFSACPTFMEKLLEREPS